MDPTLRSLISTAIAVCSAGALSGGCSAAQGPQTSTTQGDDGAGAASALARVSGADAATCTACTPATCTTVTPSNALVTDWRDVGPGGIFVDDDSFSHPNPDWWTGFYGSPYVYPQNSECPPQQTAYPLSQTIDGSWHVTGTVGDWSGFGLWLGACTVDMSAYRGIAFDVSGDPGPSGTLNLYVGTGPDTVAESCRTNVGTCNPATGSCAAPWKTITVPAAPGTPTTVLWSDLAGGSPLASPDPSQIVQVLWAFQWTDWGGVKSNPYPVDVTVGSIELVP